MKPRVPIVIVALVAGVLLSLAMVRVWSGGRNAPAIVPWPQKVQSGRGAFELGPQTRILVDAAAQPSGQYLAERLRKSTGYTLAVAVRAEPGGKDIVLTTREANPALGAEGYELTVTPDSVLIRAPGSAGLFYGVQSLLQLLPPEVFASTPRRGIKWRARCVRIEDQPRFAWRGLMLDVSRHFFNPAEIGDLLDGMALHKLNVFHWHLTDDQGWRLEIKKYPRLTEVGAWRQGIGFNLDPKASLAYGPDGRYGGYYTQAQVREIVAYAEARHITIVPEIEMPGHASAALAAYPELSCSGGPYATDVRSNLFAGVFCAGKEETFKFLEDVLGEVCELFPGSYVHVGGDEVPRQNWHECARCQGRMKQEGLKNERELESYFIRRVGTFLAARGRRMVGWSETREGGLPQEGVLMDWMGGGLEAARAGQDVVMTPETYCYLDYYQSPDRSAEPRATAAYLPLNRVYAFEPIPAELEPRYGQRVLGAQGNLWTEYIPSLKQAEYMTFPRLCALAEVLWSPRSARDWDDFARRLRTHVLRLEEMGINYRKEF